MNEVWNILGIEKTKDTSEITAAYRTRLRQVNPEDDPEGFMKLRQAYEEAKQYALTADESEKEKDEYDIWIEKAEKIYNDFECRIDESKWDEILSDRLCLGLDTQDMAMEKFTVFLMNHYYLKASVWKMIDKTFDITGNRENLLEKFPGNFIEFIISEINHNGDGDYYTYFYGDKDFDHDKLIITLSKCVDSVSEQLVVKKPSEVDFSDAKALFEEIESMPLCHAYYYVLKMVVALYENNNDEVIEYFNKLKEKINYAPDTISNNMIMWGFAMGFEVTGEAFEAAKIREKLDGSQVALYIISDNIRYLNKTERYQEMKDKTIDIMDKYAEFPAFIEYMVIANDKLMKVYKEKSDNGDIDSTYDLGWCYYQNEKFEECMSLMDSVRPETGDKLEYQYNNLTGRCLLRMEKSADAIDRLKRAYELITEVKEKGAEGDEEEKMLKREGLILTSISLAYKDIAKGKMLKNSITREDYLGYDDAMQNARDYIEKAIAVEKGNKERVYFLGDAAKIYIEIEDYKSCIDMCDLIIKEAPEWSLPYLLSENAFYKMDYPQDVMGNYHILQNMVPENESIYFYPLLECLAYNREEDAKKIYEIAVSNGVKSELLDFVMLCVNTLASKVPFNGQEIYEKFSSIKENDNIDRRMIAEAGIEAMYLRADENYINAMSGRILIVYPGFKKKIVALHTRLAERKGNYDDAVKFLNEQLYFATKEKEVLDIKLKLGRNLWYKNEDDKAFEFYSQVLRDNPKHPSVNHDLARFYLFKYRDTMSKNDIDAALTFINNQMEIGRDDRVYGTRAEIYYEIDELEKCEKDLDAAMEYSSDNFTNNSIRQKMLLCMGRFEESYKLAHELAEQEPDDNYIRKYNRLIQVCNLTERYDEAIKYIEGGREIDRIWYLKKIISIYKKMKNGSGLFEIGNYAIANARNEIEKNLGFEATLAGYIAIGEMKKALNYYVEYTFHNVKEEKKLLELINNTGTLDLMYEDMGKTRHAITFRSTVLKNTKSVYVKMKSNLSLAQYYRFAGKKRKARQYFDAFKEICEKNYGSIEEWLSLYGTRRIRFFDIGQYYYADGNLEGLEMCVNGMENAPICDMCECCNCFELYILKGHLNTLKGNIEEAVKNYEIAKHGCGNPSDNFIDGYIEMAKKKKR